MLSPRPATEMDSSEGIKEQTPGSTVMDALSSNASAEMSGGGGEGDGGGLGGGGEGAGGGLGGGGRGGGGGDGLGGGGDGDGGGGGVGGGEGGGGEGGGDGEGAGGGLGGGGRGGGGGDGLGGGEGGGGVGGGDGDGGGLGGWSGSSIPQNPLLSRDDVKAVELVAKDCIRSSTVPFTLVMVTTTDAPIFASSPFFVRPPMIPRVAVKLASGSFIFDRMSFALPKSFRITAWKA